MSMVQVQFDFQRGPVHALLNKWGERKNGAGRDMTIQLGGEIPEVVPFSIAVHITNEELFPRDYSAELILPVASRSIGAPLTVTVNTLDMQEQLHRNMPAEDGWVEASVFMPSDGTRGTLTLDGGQTAFGCDRSSPLPPARLAGYHERYGVEYDLASNLFAFLAPQQGFRVVIRTQAHLCKKCEGGGTVRELPTDPHSKRVPCPACQGSGKSGAPPFQVGEYLALRQMFQQEFTLPVTNLQEVYTAAAAGGDKLRRRARAAIATTMLDNEPPAPGVEPVLGPELVESPPPAAEKKNVCLACGGKGTSSRGNPCMPCGGTGQRAPAEPLPAPAVADASVGKPAEPPATSVPIATPQPPSEGLMTMPSPLAGISLEASEPKAEGTVPAAPPPTTPPPSTPPPAVEGTEGAAAAASESGRRKRRASAEVQAARIESARQALRDAGWSCTPPQDKAEPTLAGRVACLVQQMTDVLANATLLQQSCAEEQEAPPPPPTLSVTKEQAEKLDKLRELVDPSLQPVFAWILALPQQGKE